MKSKNILGFAVGPVGTAVLGLASLPVSTWMFGASDIGRISMLQTVTGLLVILFGLGLDQSYLREYHHAQDRHILFRLAVVPGLLLFALASAAVLLFASEQFAHGIFGSSDVGLAYAALLGVLALYGTRYFSLILRMEERGLAFSMSQLLPKVIFLGVLFILYVVDGQRIFAWLLTAHLLSVTATTFIFAWNTRRTWLRRREPVVAEAPKLASMLRYGMPLMLAGLAFWGMGTIDKMMLRYLGSFAELGIYSVAIGIASVAGTLSMIFTTIWVPTAYRWANEPDCAQRIETVARKLAAMGSILICLTGACTWMLSFLLPKEYSAVQYLVCICMVPPVLHAVAEATGIGVTIVRKSAPVMGIALLACASNIAGDWLLIPQLGARGAAVSTAAAYFILFVLRTEASIRYWATMRRWPLYAPIGGVTLMAVLFALEGSHHPNVAAAAWLGAGLLLAVLNRDTLLELLAKLRPSRRAAPAVVPACPPSAD